jgi:rhamnogalacturonan endolyase
MKTATILGIGITAICAVSFASLRSGATANMPQTTKLPPRQMENLGRGVVAVNQGGGKVYVGWRLLGTDPDGIAFNLYRDSGDGKPVKRNDKPLTATTDFVDTGVDLTQPTSYFVRPVRNGREDAPSARFTLPANAPERSYLSVPLQTPEGYTPNDASVGDLDGDGEYDIVLHQTGRGRDNSQNGETDPPILQGYKRDGTLLWTINLGKNIREGAHYTQFMVYDLDGDGRAEVVCKTADGTTDGAGTVIGDAKADYRNPSGRILSGPEFLTVFDGKTGKALATTKYIPGRHPDTENPTGEQLKEVWGDNYGNRGDRFLACVAYLDGVRPSVVMCRGYYTRTVLTAWDWRDGKLTHRWTFDSDDGTPGNKEYAGQGNHNLSVGDVDGDGKDEIVYGGMTLDDNGKGLYTTTLGHGDAMHLSDLDPDRPGLEVFRIQERFDDAGSHLYDAKTGQILWKKPSVKAATEGGDKGEGPGRGLALDIDPRYRGFECWSAGAGIVGLFDVKGNKIAERTPACNMGVYWDADPLSEILNGTTVEKWDYRSAASVRLLDAKDFSCASNNGTKANPCLSADILGDWREEVLWRTQDGKELRIFTTTIPAKNRLYTFMHDPEYRLSIAWQNVAYNQPPHTSFFVGEGMSAPPRPNIMLVPTQR